MKETKNCTICKLHKTLDNFTKRSSVKSGLDSWCRECKSKIRKTYYRQRHEYKNVNKCQRCNKVFVSTKKDSVFCSHSCALENYHLGRESYGIRNNSNGYVLELSKNHPNRDSQGYVYKHRLVVEKNIGRILNDGEVVHHIDGNKKNNNIENLLLFNSHSDHIKHHWKNK
jgi:hypothetical protein